MTAAWKRCAIVIALLACGAAGQTPSYLDTLNKQVATNSPSIDSGANIDPAAGLPASVAAPGAPAAAGSNNTMDPLVSGCRNPYHTLVLDAVTCDSRCSDKLVRADGQATIAPEVYDSKFSGLCCNCNFERTPGIVNPTYIPAAGAPVVTSAPVVTAPLDPSINLPPTTDELISVVDPAYVIIPNPGEINTYAVLRITGGPFTLPLPYEQTLAFVYAFDNVTGEPWQIKGAEPSVPGQFPAAPYGLPEVRNGPPPVPAPPPAPLPPPPPPTAAPVVAAPVVAAPGVVPAAPVAGASPAVDPATGVPAATSPAVRRRQLRSIPEFPIRRFNQGRRMMQNVSPSPAGDGNYNFSPMPGSSPDYKGNGDYQNLPPDGTGADYQSPSPNPDYTSPSPPSDGGSPSPDVNASPTNGNGDYKSPPVVSSPTTGAPPPFVPVAIVPPPLPVPSPPPMLVIPPPGPAIEMPANADGIWVFAMLPLTDAQFSSMAQLLNEATGDGNGAFMKWLQAAGMNVTSVELRYVGQASEGQIDLTKRLDGDIFGAASSTVATQSQPKSSMSTTTIAAIVGGVVGGVLLIAIAGVLVATNRRKSSKAMKESLTQRWRTERELGK